MQLAYDVMLTPPRAHARSPLRSTLYKTGSTPHVVVNTRAQFRTSLVLMFLISHAFVRFTSPSSSDVIPPNHDRDRFSSPPPLRKTLNQKGGREERIGGNDAAPSRRRQRPARGSPSPRPLRGQRVPARRSGAHPAPTDGRDGRRPHGCSPACRRAPARP